MGLLRGCYLAKYPAHGKYLMTNNRIIRSPTGSLPSHVHNVAGHISSQLKEQPTFIVYSLCAGFYTTCFANTISLNPTVTCDRRKGCSITCLVLFLPLGRLYFPLSLVLGLGRVTNSGHLGVWETIMPVTAWLEDLMASPWPWCTWSSFATRKSATPIAGALVTTCFELSVAQITVLLIQPLMAAFPSFLIFSLPYQCFLESRPPEILPHILVALEITHYEIAILNHWG